METRKKKKKAEHDKGGFGTITPGLLKLLLLFLIVILEAYRITAA